MNEAINSQKILEASYSAFWDKTKTDLRHELITLLSMKIDRPYETISKFFEKRNSNIGGLSPDDLLLTDNGALLKTFLHSVNIKTQSTFDEEL